MMRHDAGIPLRRIHADGGAAANRFLVRFIADVTGLELEVAQAPDFSPLGAAMAGALGMGIYRSLDELARLPRESISHRPTTDKPTVEKYYAEWKRAVKRLLDE
jgi:glycerol kinase